MGVFDRYRQSNSTQINRYAGAPVEEMARVGMHLQGQYDINKDQLDVLDRTLSSSPVLGQDRELLKNELQTVRQGLSSAVEKGNYEDMSHQVRNLGRDFAQKYQPFAKNNALYQERLKEIDENKDISATTKELLKREAADYGGLKRGEDGQLGGFFSGQSIAKDVNMDEFTRKALEGMMANSHGSEGFSVVSAGGGEYFMESGGKRTSISAERVRAAVQQAAALNPEVGAYLSQHARLNTRGFEKMTFEQASKLGGEQGSLIAARAQELADANNIPFGQAYKRIAQQTMVQGVLGMASEYGANTKAYEQTESFNRIGKETADGQVNTAGRSAAASRVPENRVEYPGGLGGPVDGRSANDMQTQVSDLNKNIKEYEKQLASTTDPVDKATYEAELSNLKMQRGENQRMLKVAAQNATKDLPETITAKYSVADRFKGKPDNVKLTRGAVEKAMTVGNYKKVGNGYEIKLSNGSTVVIEKSSFSSLSDTWDDMTGKSHLMGKKNDTSGRQLNNAISSFEKSVKSGTSHTFYQTQQVSMTTAEKKQFGDDYVNMAGAPFEVYSAENPDKPLKDSDKPAAIDFASFGVIQHNGETLMRGIVLDDKGKPTQDVVYVKAKPGSNVTEHLSGNMVREVKGNMNTSNARNANMMNTPVAEKIATLPDNGSVDLGGVYLQKYITPGTKTPVYRFLDSDGDVITRDGKNNYPYGMNVEQILNLSSQLKK